jgi:hypothetical protein
LEKQENLKPDLIFFTGDVTLSGDKEQYKSVGRHFFDPLLEITGLDKSRLFMVPGNHDVERSRIHRLAFQTVRSLNNDTEIKRLFDDPEELRLNMRRLDAYREFLQDYCSIPSSDERPYYTRTIEVYGWRVGVIGLNTVWTSGSVKDEAKEVKDRGELLIGRHLVAKALEEIRRDSPDVLITLMHHPFDWLIDFDQAQVQGLLAAECHFILRGHLHRTETLYLANPDAAATIIAAGAICRRSDYPGTYNVVRLDRNKKQCAIYLRRYGEKDCWGADTLTYRNVPNGEYTFPLPDRLSTESHSPLRRWLDQHGLFDNPFGLRDASLEREKNLSGYFVDGGGFFDEFSETQIPCVVFAARGCGKTAYRKMLASDCRPAQRKSSQLAVMYTYSSFERILKAAGDDIDRIEVSHHVAELLRTGLIALNAEAERDIRIRESLEQPDVAALLAAYQIHYTPHLTPSPSAVQVVDHLDNLSSVELMQGFSKLIQAAGLQSLIVLVNELDDFKHTTRKPEQQVALLAPLLGILPILRCPGIAFKFLLPEETESILRNQVWFSPDRMRTFHIRWDENTLKQLMSSRLTYFSARSGQTYTQMGQFCEDDLRGSIDSEIAHLADKSPRAALLLADRLLQGHCVQPGQPDRITRTTWESLKSQWPALRADTLSENV